MSGSIILLTVLAAVVLAAVLGILLARFWRVRESTAPLVVLLLCALFGTALVVAGWPPNTGIDLGGGTILIYDVTTDLPATEPGDATETAPPSPEAGASSMQTLVAAVARRVNPSGVKEVTIRPYGPDRLEIIVPETGRQEIDRLKRILGRVGAVQFRILANQRDDKTLIERAVHDDGAEVRNDQGELLAWWVPVAEGQEADLRKYSEIPLRTVERDGRKITEVLVMNDDFNVTGAHIVRATAGANLAGQRHAQYHLDPAGGRLLGSLTSGKVPGEAGSFTRKLGIMVDGCLVSASPIKEAVFQNGEITGNYTQQQLRDLADVLDAGPLPKALSAQPVRELTAGPLLGTDTIRYAKLALAIGLALVLALLLILYRFAGLVACGALLLNLLVLVALLMAVRMTLTLSCFAGLLLTFATALGAHVLIFERIREELDREAPLRTAIRNGFSKAQSAILDTGAAILIVATILFFVRVGAIKGFAVTLWIGTILSWVTAVYCSRVVFDIAERRRWITRLKMTRLPGRSGVNFLRIRFLAAVLLVVAAALSAAGLWLRGPSLLGVEFAGGASVEARFQQPQAVATVRRGLIGLPDREALLREILNRMQNQRGE